MLTTSFTHPQLSQPQPSIDSTITLFCNLVNDAFCVVCVVCVVALFVLVVLFVWLATDAAKGIEDRTRKLMEVCRMRQLPIFTFVNKMDRPALEPFVIMDQLEKEFNLECCPMNWPIGEGESFQGVYDRESKKVHLFQRGDRRKKVTATVVDIDDPDLEDVIGSNQFLKLMEDIDMLDSLIPPPDMDRIQVASFELFPFFPFSAFRISAPFSFLSSLSSSLPSPPIPFSPFPPF